MWSNLQSLPHAETLSAASCHPPPFSIAFLETKNLPPRRLLFRHWHQTHIVVICPNRWSRWKIGKLAIEHCPGILFFASFFSLLLIPTGLVVPEFSALRLCVRAVSSPQLYPPQSDMFSAVFIALVLSIRLKE